MDDRSRPAPSADSAAYEETSPFQAAEPERLLTRAIPVSAQLPRYRAPSARRDLLAGVTVAALGLVEPQAWRALAAVDQVEVAIAGVTTGCVVVFGVLEALGVAVGLSVIDTVRRSARPHDAVLGWVERLGRYGDVSLHRRNAYRNRPT